MGGLDYMITVLEYVTENGNYAFYEAYGEKTPREAIKTYLYEMSIEGKIRKDKNTGGLIVEDVCIAYETELK